MNIKETVLEILFTSFVILNILFLMAAILYQFLN
jgi:hypothetical protein